jgi:hypothetical protein
VGDTFGGNPMLTAAMPERILYRLRKHKKARFLGKPSNTNPKLKERVSELVV